MKSVIENTFGNRIRIRVCGILIKDDKILLANHSGLNSANVFWIPPGGGIKFGEHIKEALVREFQEEAGIEIEPESLAGIYEYVEPPLHAVEFFYSVTAKTSVSPVKGNDPELKEKQIIDAVKFVTFKELAVIPNENKHRILHNIKSASDLLNLNGGFNI